jgi:hypothetical protein
VEEILIAPCGMNCAVCSAYIVRRLDMNKHGIRRKYCVGCRPRGQNCIFMSSACEAIGKGKHQFCYECPDFPCARLKRLDKRYTKYNISMIENLTMIKERGMDAFLKKEEKKWQCPQCGDVVCCHTGACYACIKNQPKHTWKKIPPDKVTEIDLIAPCGMNCGVCSAYLAMKNGVTVAPDGKKAAWCQGCLPRGRGCTMNKSGGCQKLMTLSVRFCYECKEFPCDANMHWDKVYREKYNASPVENLKYIKKNGIDKFLELQREKWKCPDCGGVISCHNGVCYQCEAEKQRK